MTMDENQNIEYKESWRDEYLQWVCGMANSIGGTIFIGKDDKGRVVGVQKAKKLQEDIPNKVKDTMGVIVNCLLHEEGGKEYLEITVPSTSFAVNYHGHFYYRSGATNLELTYGMLHTFLLGKNGMNWDDVPVPNVTIDDLDRDSFKIFRREALRKKRMLREELDSLTNEELLTKLHLRTEDGALKRAAILLFHEDPERWFTGAYIKVGRFTGSDLRYQDDLHGSLMQQADRITDLVFTKYLIAEVGYDNITRVETYPYSKEAFREGIFNAIMHKAYETGNPIQIRIDDDRMYLSNGVAFNFPWTPEKLLSPHESNPKNPAIAHVFYRAGYIEAWGRGIKKMCDACKDWGQPMPEYIKSPGGLRLLFHALPTAKEMQIADGGMKSGMKDAEGWPKSGQKTGEGGQKSGQKTGEGGQKSGQKTNESGQKRELSFFVSNTKYTIPIDTTQGQILLILLENPFATQATLRKITGITRSTIQKHLIKFKEYGIIKRVGPDKGGYWECIAPENGDLETGGQKVVKSSGQKVVKTDRQKTDGRQKSRQKTDVGGQKGGGYE